MIGEFLRGQIYQPINKLEFHAFNNSKRATNLSFERELINKSSDNFVFRRILFTKENYIIFLNTPVSGYAVLGTHTVQRTVCRLGVCLPVTLFFGKNVKVQTFLSTQV